MLESFHGADLSLIPHRLFQILSGAYYPGVVTLLGESLLLTFILSNPGNQEAIGEDEK